MLPRIRTIKHEFFSHEGLYNLEVETQLPIRVAFAGLWIWCDREGRFQWRPRELKTHVLPYDEVDFSRVLDAMASRQFIVKYEVDGETFGFIPSWKKHQYVNNKEKASLIPPPPTIQIKSILDSNAPGQPYGEVFSFEQDSNATATRPQRDSHATTTRQPRDHNALTTEIRDVHTGTGTGTVSGTGTLKPSPEPVKRARVPNKPTISDLDYRKLTDALQASFEDRYGEKPTWNKAEYSQLAALLKISRKPPLTQEDILRRYDLMLQSTVSFHMQQGGSLKFFCTHFDGFVEPLPQGRNGNGTKPDPNTRHERNRQNLGVDPKVVGPTR